MDLIRPLRGVLNLIAAHISLELDTVDPLDAGDDKTHGLLEYHAALGPGRMVLFGFYQSAAESTITAAMWVVAAASPERPVTRAGSVAQRFEVWSYGPATDEHELARTIVAEITTWLHVVRSACDDDSDMLCGGA